MKSTKIWAVLALLAASMLMLSVPASAATLTEVFTASNGQVFSLHEARLIAPSGGNLNITFKDGGATGGYLPDAGGTVLAKIIASEGFSKQWVNLLGTQIYLNVNATKYVYCNLGTGVLTMGWSSVTINTDFSDPGCATYAQIKALGN